ncbi:GNAT family N-acetyltransferase [Tropicimonas sediminicola]|uniref:Predicted N-acetyltransferase YhbS n=1 Tax=Tropicimonas sediminicola TaxID=1031541 RepID=A0A239ICF5_9RHOB|nr:GNAT family N-acetyltransferase [Tropicimonas sediminicola]SNS91092.1 Predicted N-acetyltransferase YhbS [Tropicimonas sediminicola]
MTATGDPVDRTSRKALPCGIRRATTADETAIRACVREAYGRYVADIGREPAPMQADYARHIAAGETWVATATDGGFLGFVVFYPDGSAMHLDSVAVARHAERRGIGRALIGFCEETARRAGFGAVRLYTNAKMTDNLTIYPRLGFRETGRHRQDGFDRVFFEKRLSPETG